LHGCVNGSDGSREATILNRASMTYATLSLSGEFCNGTRLV